MSFATVTAGSAVYGTRSATADLGDGPLSFGGVLGAGVLMVALPVAIAVGIQVWREGATMLAPALVLSVAAALLIAVLEPGNLFGVGFLMISSGALLLLSAIAWADRRRRRRRSP